MDRRPSKKTGKYQDATAANKREQLTDEGDLQSSRAAAAAAAGKCDRNRYNVRTGHRTRGGDTPISVALRVQNKQTDDRLIYRPDGLRRRGRAKEG